MMTQDAEPEIEALLHGLEPTIAKEWQGASLEQVAQVERIAGRPLPRFYRWFLDRMGRRRDKLSYASVDFSSETILASYSNGEVSVPTGRFLMVGFDTNPSLPLHVFYDLDRPVRDDARVVRMAARGGSITVLFDTFREMLAWGAFSAMRIQGLTHLCDGHLSGQEDLLTHLDPVMTRLGFQKFAPTGPCCAIYDRGDAAMLVKSTPRDPPSPFLFFNLGGADQSELRRVLGAIATQTSIETEITEWRPGVGQAS